MKKSKSYYRERYKYYKEMTTHYKELYEVAVKELKFARMQKWHLRSIVDEIEELSKQKVKYNLINAVIDNWLKRETIDYSIHYDLEYWWIK